MNSIKPHNTLHEHTQSLMAINRGKNSEETTEKEEREDVDNSFGFERKPRTIAAKTVNNATAFSCKTFLLL